MTEWEATLAAIYADHAVMLYGWLFAFAALYFHFFINRRRQRWVDTAVVFLFALLLATLCTYAYGGDDVEYLASARNLLGGYGAVDETGTVVLQRIGYTLIFSAAYLLGGLDGTTLLAGLGFAFFCVPAFWFARSLYGDRIAAAAILLFMLFPRAFEDTGIDNLVGGFVFLAFSVLVSAPRKSDAALGLLAALLLAAGYLCKEIAVLGIGFPLLMLMFRSERGVARRHLVCFATSLCLVVLIAAVQRYFSSTPPAYFRLGGEGPPTDVDAPLRYALSLAKGALGYFWWPGHDAALFGWAAVFAVVPAAFGLLVWRARHGSRADTALLAALVIWLPLLAFTGERDWRPEQALNFLALGFAAVAVLTGALCRHLSRRELAFGTATAVITLSLPIQGLWAERSRYTAPADVALEQSALGHLVSLRPLRLQAELVNGTILAAAGAGIAEEQLVWSSPVQRGITAGLAANRHFWVAPVPLHALIRPGYASGYLAFTKNWISRITGPIWGIYAAAEPRSPLFVLYRADLVAGFRDVALILMYPGRAWVHDLPNLLSGRLLTKLADLQWGPLPLASYHWDGPAFARNIERQFIDRHALVVLARLTAEEPALFAWYQQQLRAGGVEIDAATVAALLAAAPAEGDPVVALR